MRVTGGSLRGRRLFAPPPGVRPTSDRVREAMFARLGDLDRASVLDLYAGTGTLGIEALSRGAERLVCVERAPRALAVLRRNVASLEIGDRVRVVAGDAVRTLRRMQREDERFDLVLLDPPYAADDEARRVLDVLAEGGVLDSAGTLVIERGRRHPVPDVRGLAVLDERRYGDTVVVRLRRAAEAAPQPEKRGACPV